MSVRTRDEIMEQLRTVIGENDSDDVLTLMTDISDTLGDNKDRERVTQLEQQLQDNDREWRKKYRDAFFSKPDESLDDEDESKTPSKFEDLFTTK